MAPVTVAVFYNVLDALIFKSFLESYSVTCFLADDTFLSIHPMASQAIGGVKLNVHPDDFEKARALFQSFKEGKNEDLLAEIPHCPEGSSDSVLPLPPEPGIYYNEFRCFDCDHEWNDRNLHDLNPGHIE